jgi:hypothetical protein
MLRRIRPNLTFAAARPTSHLEFGNGRDERRGGALSISLSCTVDAAMIFRAFHALVQTPFALAGAFLFVKTLVERARECERVTVAAKRARTPEAESAVPGDAGVECALMISIPIVELDRGKDECGDNDEFESMHDDASWSSMGLSEQEWSFVSDDAASSEEDANEACV